MTIPKPLDSLRALCRYETHGGYVWAGVMADGELMCVPCLRSEYRSVFRATRADGISPYTLDWQLVGLTHSGESETTEHCAHCNKAIWEHEETPVTPEVTYCVNVWAERDRMHIHLIDSNDKTIAEWWDDEAQSMFDDGWFQGGRNLKQSVLDYARQSLIVPKDARLT